MKKSDIIEHLKEQAKLIRQEKLDIKEEHRCGISADYYKLEDLKEQFREEHIAYTITKKNFKNKEFFEELTAEKIFKEIKSKKIETPNKKGEFKYLNHNAIIAQIERFLEEDAS